jgi:hypothetical protein
MREQQGAIAATSESLCLRIISGFDFGCFSYIYSIGEGTPLTHQVSSLPLFWKDPFVAN